MSDRVREERWPLTRARRAGATRREDELEAVLGIVYSELINSPIIDDTTTRRN